MASMLNSREFAAPMADGGYAIPSLANPVVIDPAFTTGRQDFWGENTRVGDAIGAVGDYWGAVWDIMTGNAAAPSEKLTDEEKAIESSSGAAPGSGGYTYFIMFAVAVGALYFMRKGR